MAIQHFICPDPHVVFFLRLETFLCLRYRARLFDGYGLGVLETFAGAVLDLVSRDIRFFLPLYSESLFTLRQFVN